MKKRNIINLIKYHMYNADSDFRSEAYAIAKDFNNNGDTDLAEYIMALLSDANAFVPQMYEHKMTFFKQISTSNTDSLPLPDAIKDDLMGIIYAMKSNAGINRFLFAGSPGTGKTESVKQVARISNRGLFQMNFNAIIDSRLGQTAKNLDAAFEEINNIPRPETTIILLDEIDAIALNRIDSNDLREMGRATSTLLQEIDNLNRNITLIATTNLHKMLDRALLRRFDAVIDFDRYSREDLCEIAEIILKENKKSFPKSLIDDSGVKLFKKILSIPEHLPNPGTLKNLIRTSLAFSNPDQPYNYLVKLYVNLVGREPELKTLRDNGFSVRDIEKITGISKSQVSRSIHA